MKNLESPIKSSRILLVKSCFNTNKAESLRSVQKKKSYTKGENKDSCPLNIKRPWCVKNPTEKILNGKLHFLFSENVKQMPNDLGLRKNKKRLSEGIHRLQIFLRAEFLLNKQNYGLDNSKRRLKFLGWWLIPFKLFYLLQTK